MIDFDDIKTKVTVRDVLADGGFYPKRSRMPCPIHDGSNPTSFSFTDEGFICFSCGVSGGLLDLAEALFDFDRQKALKYLADRAGITYEPDFSKQGSKNETPIRSEPLGLMDVELLELRLDLKALEVLREHFTRRMQQARKALRERAINLSKYYSETQYCQYVLEDLDTEVIKTNYETTIKRRALSDGIRIGSK